MAKSSGLVELYNDYDSCFGGENGLGVGDMIRMEEEKQQKEQPRLSAIKKSKYKKARKDNVEIIGEDCNADEGQYSIRTDIVDDVLKDQKSSELHVIENVIPNDLKEINADRFLNCHLEAKYHEIREKNDDCESHVEEPTPIETNTPIVKKLKEKKVKRNNALVESLKKNGMIKNETSDTSLASSTSSCSTTWGSDSSQDFLTAHTSGEDSFHSTGSAASPLKKTICRKHMTSQRHKVKEDSINFAKKATISRPAVASKKREQNFIPYEPEYIEYDYTFKEDEFPAISK